ncbi:hypothetical protein RHGRI_005637 [Rhododendron griersonianum]|uniref:Endonuclease/exonuclease/phosphatase domain-containing protein n=1 Tax=Rhododendron griersonianum TaxID=479676 RepID=A0AAV6LD30_9ERIC|nr:hypothetical protein RHGRI_005637 [Rhododendron griersonianum]
MDSMGSFFNNFGLTSSYFVDPIGRSGGIWVIWDPTKVTVATNYSNPQAVHVTIQRNGFASWFLSVVYASPNPRLRETLWEDLNFFAANNNNNPWVAAGDFNEVATADESRSNTPDSSASARRRFADNINNCDLMDMGFTGPKLTWTNGRQGLACVQKRLDRGLCNEEWRELFPEGMIQTLPRTYSDHSPLILHTAGIMPLNPSVKPFRFEAAWILDPSFENMVSQTWKGVDLLDHIKNFSDAALDWNKKVFGNIFRKKRWVLSRINGIQMAQANGFSHNLQILEKDLVSDYNNILTQEEVLWFQKSRAKWIVHGERNTRYFHMSTIIRRRKSKISMLKDNNNIWTEDPLTIKDLVQNYFVDLFREPNLSTDISRRWVYLIAIEEEEEEEEFSVSDPPGD